MALAESAIASGTVGGSAYADPDARPQRFLGRRRPAARPAARPDLALFGEGPSRVLLSVARADLPALLAALGDLPVSNVGRVTAGPLSVIVEGAGGLELPVPQLHEAYESLPSELR